MLVDSHCHIDFNDFEDDIEEIIQRMKDSGVTAALNAGNGLEDFENQLKLSNKYPFIYTAVGVHPHNADEYTNVTAEDLIANTKHKKVVGIGECGLDYYYDYSAKDNQIRLFKEHIKAAQETGLPLIIHTREADDDTISILDEMYKQKPFSGEIHCFSSSKELADFALSIGFYISASGIITFNKSGDLRDIFETIPNERLLVETDSPFLAPIPLRGHRNEPANVKYVAEKLAQIKNMSYEDMVDITSHNFYKLFRKASDKGRYNY
ncbi:MAG: TatD family hydrolase [Rhodospirillales bacterium]|nr:TatD family hydrolase [Rhodospirillales bacterium]